MVGNLTVDISPDTDIEYMAHRKRQRGFSLDEWDFEADFGRFTDTIVPVFEDAIDNYLKEETPFYVIIPLLDYFEEHNEDPNRPLKLMWSFGLNEDRDAYVYETSLDERVALQFEMLRMNDEARDKYLMTAARVEKFKLFATALRELADKIDVELTKVKLEQGTSHGG